MPYSAEPQEDRTTASRRSRPPVQAFALASMLAAVSVLACGLTPETNSCTGQSTTIGQSSASGTAVGTVLNTQHRNFQLVTPLANVNVNCRGATFVFEWQWADPSRQNTDASRPPLTNLAAAFQFTVPLGSTLSPGIFETEGSISSLESGGPPYTWHVPTFTEHPGDQAGGVYYGIYVGLDSTATARDSVRVFATIQYY